MNKKKTTRSCHKEKTSNKFSGLKDYITNKCSSQPVCKNNVFTDE